MIILTVITDKYAGNFERELCAHMTGQIGDCGVGEEYAEKTREELPDFCDVMDEYIEQIPDEHGCFRPVSINGNHVNNVEIYFNAVPDAKSLQTMIERSHTFKAKYEDVKILGAFMEEETTTRVPVCLMEKMNDES